MLDVLDGSTVPSTLYYYTLKLRHVTILLLRVWAETERLAGSVCRQ